MKCRVQSLQVDCICLLIGSVTCILCYVHGAGFVLLSVMIRLLVCANGASIQLKFVDETSTHIFCHCFISEFLNCTTHNPQGRFH